MCEMYKLRVSARPLQGLPHQPPHPQLAAQTGPPAVSPGSLRQLRSVRGKAGGHGGPGGAGRALVAGAQGPGSPLLPRPRLGTILGGVDPAPTSDRAPAVRAAGGVAAPRIRAADASAAMSGRSVPHAHPATTEYEFANPSRLGEQRFGEGTVQTPPPHPPPPEILGWPPNGAGLHPTAG